MFNMPNSPSTGNTVAGPGGVQWQYDGTKWVAMAPALNSIALTGNPTAPTPLTGDNSQSIATTAFVHNNYLPLVGGALSGNLSFSGTVGIVGNTAGGNAPAGQIGEVISGAQATATSLTSGTALNLVTLALTAGDWRVEGTITFTPSAAPTSITAAINIVSATAPTAANITAGSAVMTQLRLSFTSAQAQTFQTGTMRVNNSTSGNVYLIAQATFASGTCTATGIIAARRMR